MPIFEKNKSIFIHIPKTGGTSVIKKYDPTFLDFKHYDLLYYKDLLKDKFDNYSIFSIVRNPYERILSYFHFHIQHSIYVINWLLKEEIKDPKSLFSSYLNLMLKKNPLTVNGRRFLVCRTQTSFLINDKKEIDKRIQIIKYENLNQEISDLTRENSTKYVKNLEIYYTKDIKDYIYYYFLDDFINFNYDR